MYRMLDMAKMDAEMEGYDKGIAWQKAQSQAQIDRLSGEIARLTDEIAELKKSQSKDAAQQVINS